MVDREEPVSVETTGASVTEAIAEGLERLGLELDDVNVEVLIEASRGVFGLGSRDARVRLTTKVAEDEAPEDGGAEDAGAAAEVVEPARARIVRRPAPARTAVPVGRRPTPAVETTPPEPVEAEPEVRPEGAGDPDQVALVVMMDLLSLMGIEGAQVDARRSEPTEDDADPPLMLDVKAPNDTLIGPRGETLSALQHITRLIVGREQGGRARLVVDVNGYRVRRERQLRQLARRLAQQAIDTDSTVVLEPMTPFERRIVHIALRDHPDVTTHSIGEGNHRKVTIVPRFE